MRSRRAQLALAAVLAAALAVVTTSCRGSSVDKAGGKTRKHATVVLRLATHEMQGINGDIDFASAVRRLSKGSMEIKVTTNWRTGDAEHEKKTIEDVEAGNFDLGVVGVRAFDEVGVRSFQALVAPFLIDNSTLEQRVLESPLAARMLDGVRRIHLVGIALVPGALRLPLGISRALVGPEDYQGTRIGIRPGGVAAATFRALGSTPVPYIEGSLSGLDGAELDLWTIGLNAYDKHARALTVNVVLWPRTQAIVMSTKAFEALTAAQQKILRDAGRAVVAPELTRLSRLSKDAFRSMCRGARTVFVTASVADLAALRKAVQPVYDQLDRDAQTKQFIAAISAMHGGATGPEPELSCRGGGSRHDQNNVGSLTGRWKWIWTRAELIHAGITPDNAKLLAGPGSVDFKAGRLRTRAGLTGTYRVNGDLITFVFDPPGGAGVTPGVGYELKWSVYRDRLTFAQAPGRDPLLALLIKPLTRVR